MAKWFSNLWAGKKSAATAGTKKQTTAGKKPASSRDQLIKDAMRIHHASGASVRAVIRTALKGLEDRRTLRDPEALERLLAVVRAQRTITQFMDSSLRRYLVLAGLRHWAEVKSENVEQVKKPRSTVARG